METGNAVDVYPGGHIPAGEVADPSSFPGAYLLKTDNNGNQLWNRLYRRGNSMKGEDVVSSSDGGFVMTGTVGNFRGQDTTFILKTDNNGEMQWSKLFYFGQGEKCYPTSVMQTSDSGFAQLSKY